MSHSDKNAVILLSHKELGVLSTLELKPDILIIPEPAYISKGFIESIRHFKMETLIFCSYRSLYWSPPGYEKIINHISGKKIDFYNVRECGAVRIELKPSGISINPVLDCNYRQTD
ncbi:MAG TPA: hypothetical protein ENO07_06345 [candidate division Zixibacteria bacterium]|nr:hypothetical protein [candidate division Zixibacteria bacterium]